MKVKNGSKNHTLTILLELSDHDESTDVIILRIQALVGQAHLMGTDTHIPWGKLERDVVVAEMSVLYPIFYIQGVHAIHKVSDGSEDPTRFHICTFNFSRQGCSTLWDVDDETVWIHQET